MFDKTTALQLQNASLKKTIACLESKTDRLGREVRVSEESYNKRLSNDLSAQQNEYEKLLDEYKQDFESVTVENAKLMQDVDVLGSHLQIEVDENGRLAKRVKELQSDNARLLGANAGLEVKLFVTGLKAEKQKRKAVAANRVIEAVQLAIKRNR